MLWRKQSLILIKMSAAVSREHQVSPSQANLHKPEEHRDAQKQAGTQIKELQGTTILSGPLPELSQQSHQLQCPVVKPITMSHWEQLSRSGGSAIGT